MTQATKGALWQELKAAGVTFPLHYREYTMPQLQKVKADLDARNAALNQPAPQLPPVQQPQLPPQPQQPVPFAVPEAVPVPTPTIVAAPDTEAGLRLNTHGEDEPIRVDPNGRIWYQDEVKKKAFAAPRGRRVYRYNDPGVKQGSYISPDGTQTESFEMPGDRSVPSEAKITLPSFQVGIYRDPGSPFRTHTYNGQRGFDLFDVEEFYGGPDMVPEGVKRIHVYTSLCYDIRTVVRAIKEEHRELVLRKGN